MQEGYNHYPLSNIFGYYGPMHDGPVWPLYLIPRDLPLVAAWRVDYPPQGDRIGECILYTHTLDEICELTDNISRFWSKGAHIIESLSDYYKDDYERKNDIAIVKALRLQFQSGNNIMRFYKLRQELIWDANSRREKVLDEMEVLVKEEIKVSKDLLELAGADSRLGFQSEAEAYKYYPDRLSWRIEELEKLIELEFPAVRMHAKQGLPLFPGFTGEEPEGEKYKVMRGEKADILLEANPEQEIWGNARWEKVECEDGSIDEKTGWKVLYDEKSICFAVKCENFRCSDKEYLEFAIEPKRLWPALVGIIDFKGNAKYGHVCNFLISGCYQHRCNWRVVTEENGETGYIKVEIPFEELEYFGYEIFQEGHFRPIRFNIRRKGIINSRWVYKPTPKHRLVFNYENHDEMGWLLFEE